MPSFVTPFYLRLELFGPTEKSKECVVKTKMSFEGGVTNCEES